MRFNIKFDLKETGRVCTSLPSLPTGLVRIFFVRDLLKVIGMGIQRDRKLTTQTERGLRGLLQHFAPAGKEVPSSRRYWASSLTQSQPGNERKRNWFTIAPVERRRRSSALVWERSANLANTPSHCVFSVTIGTGQRARPMSLFVSVSHCRISFDIDRW